MTAIDNSHNGFRVSSLNSTFVSPKRPLPNLAPLNTDRKSSLPKGCRFRDLGEAHRNITGRSISASYGGDDLTRRMSSSTNNTDMDSPFRDTAAHQEEDNSRQDFLHSPLSPSSMDLLNDLGCPEDLIDKSFDRKGTRSCSPVLVSTPASKKENCPPPVRRVSDENMSPLRYVRNSQGPDRSSDSHMAMTVASTDTTVGRLYTQYQAHILNPLYANNSSPVPVIPHIIRAHEGAVNRLGFDGHSNPTRGDLAVRPLPSVNIQRSQDEKGKTPGETPTNSPRHGSLVLTVPTRESLMYPKPLRVQSMRVEVKHTSLHSGTAVSAAGMTTDSEEDPFRYDKDAYNVFLHPSKERDVSAALNHISDLSSHSRATLYSQEDYLPARKTSLRPPPIPKEYLGEDPFLTGPTQARSPTPESADGFYDTSVIQPNWAVERSAYEVKVVLQDVSRNPSVNAGRRSKIGEGSTTTSEKPFRSSTQNPFQTGNLYHRRDKENMLSSERDDWETVATTAPGFGSMQLHPPTGRGLGAINSRGAKVTGSSVADVSDDNSFYDVPFDEYASTDRIVQHPSGHEDSEESLQIHHISGTKVPVMVPKHRVHRVNGYPQNSSRMFPPSQRSGTEAAAALARKVSSPFRQLSGRRPHRFSPMPLQPPPFKLEKGRRKFEFRHHSQNSDRDPLFANGGVYEFQGVSSDTGNTRSETNNITVSELDDEDGDGHSLRDSSSSKSSNGTAHSFPFPLIPLPEAARLQAVERATVTESSNADTFWARGAANKKRLRGPERIRVPERTNQRASTRLASVFASSSTRSSNQSNRLKKRRTLPKDLTMQSAMSSMTAGGTWATILPIGSTSTLYGGPTHMLKSAATRLHLDDLSRRFQERKRPSFTVGSSVISRDSQPRLYPWDYQARRRQRARGTDPELRAIALSEPGCARDLERSGVPLDPEAFISHEGRHRRKTWFYCMLVVSMFPFISVMVYLGKFDSGLSWYSRGEVDRLNTRQRRVILVVMVAQFVLWPIVLGLVIWRTQQLARLN